MKLLMWIQLITVPAVIMLYMMIYSPFSTKMKIEVREAFEIGSQLFFTFLGKKTTTLYFNTSSYLKDLKELQISQRNLKIPLRMYQLVSLPPFFVTAILCIQSTFQTFRNVLFFPDKLRYCCCICGVDAKVTGFPCCFIIFIIVLCRWNHDEFLEPWIRFQFIAWISVLFFIGLIITILKSEISNTVYSIWNDFDD
jgi:NADH:ubiquinone oxidoreductase subunit 6 (subunit J)